MRRLPALQRLQTTRIPTYPTKILYAGDTFRFPAGTRLSPGCQHFDDAAAADAFVSLNPGAERLSDRTVRRFRDLDENAEFVVIHTTHENISDTPNKPSFIYRIEAVPAGTPRERIREHRVWFYEQDAFGSQGIPEVVLVAEAPVVHITVESAHPATPIVAPVIKTG